MPVKYVVCGGNTLTFRLVTELRALPDVEVTIIAHPGRHDPDAPLDSLDGVDLIDSDRLDEATFARAGLAASDAVAFTEQDDIANLDAALLAREIAPGIRVVLRMFDEVLATSVHDLMSDCAVLSATEVAAPAFVAAAVGVRARTPLHLFNRPVYVTDRAYTSADDVLCGLAVTDGSGEPSLLPAAQADADLVLTRSVVDAETGPAVATAADVHRRARRRAALALASLVGRRLQWVLGALLVIVAIGAALLVPLAHVSLWHGIYLSVLSTFAGAQPDLSAGLGLEILHIVFTVLSIALIPLVTAAVVETVVSARLALANGELAGPIEGHIVVVGLGDVGTRVLTALDDLGMAVVGVDRDPHARGVAVARQRRIPIIIGDAGRQETLHSASAQSARSLVVLTSSDLANVQTALLARKINPQTRSVLRIFDTSFAERIQRSFPFITSRSVSALAAPSFAAAMHDQQIVATIPVQRRVLLVAELPVGTGSPIDGRTVGELQRPGQVRIVGIRTGRGAQVLWLPPGGRKLTRTDTILIVSNRDGLGDMLHRAAPPEEITPLTVA
ncbi:MAG TPA: NAD-binding protein [Micromonosporaceae bacterium]|jgi:Trk K+ transport system NAD-binding subunit